MHNRNRYVTATTTGKETTMIRPTRRPLRAQLAALLALAILAAAALPVTPFGGPTPTAAAGGSEPCYYIGSKLTGYVLQVGQVTYRDVVTGEERREPNPRLDAALVVAPKKPLQDESPGAVYRDRVL